MNLSRARPRRIMTTLVLVQVLALIAPPFPGILPRSDRALAGETGATERISISSAGAEGNSQSQIVDVSGDGRYVAFSSTASTLVPDDTNGVGDVFVRDRISGTTTRISVSSAGAQADQLSGVPSISADGRWVTFASLATNLVPADTNGKQDIFLHDRADGTTVRISLTGSGQQAGGHSFSPSISGDSRYIAYTTYSELEFGGAGSGLVGVYRYDRVTGSVLRVCIRANGRTSRKCIAPAISDDGRYVAFESHVALVPEDTNPWTDIYLRDFAAGTTALVSLAPGGAQATSSSYAPSISGDGSAVAFSSYATNLVTGDTNGAIDVFVRDLTAGTTSRASVSSAGAQALSASFTRSCDCASRALSSNGRYVAFYSFSANIVDNDTNGTADVFVHDRWTGATTRASVTAAGAEANGFSRHASISADGMFVAFESFASNLVPGDTNSVGDVFVRSLAANTPPAVIVPADLQVYLRDGLEVSGSFSDPDPGQTWTATVDYGEGDGDEPLALSGDMTFELRHRYAEPGDYRIDVAVTDSFGARSAGSFLVGVDLKRVILYVHGTTGDFTRLDFPVLRSPLEARYEVQNYEFYEDRGNAVVGDPKFACQIGRQRSIPTFSTDAFTRYEFEPDQPEGAPGVCDSNDSIELNAVILDGDVADLLTRSDRVTLISNSGGAAIVRGYLAYASAAATGTLAGVDLSVSLEGVQTGTYLAAAYASSDFARSDRPIHSWVQDRALEFFKKDLVHDPTRPAFQDVVPQGPFQRYIARADAIPNEPHYLNVAGDLVVNVHYFLLFWEYRDPDVVPVGDFVMLPGFDDPTAPSPLGGALFLPSSIGRGRSSAEWTLRREFDVVADTFSSNDLSGALAGGIAAAFDDPAAHHNLSRMDEICVAVPSGAPKRLNHALFDAIASLDRGVHDPATLGFGKLNRVTCP
ncbi:MAG: hypothetical protein A3H36_01460 [Chloroflexi bacterium RIFCSPLOWO2_02_FULL_71_16]|nr:MAG: hypothetical protein A3H36_01460 [Chloroflexi bacterium RIFCSPLOWO2_02_FULL_71_16]